MINIVCNAEDLECFRKLLGDGSRLGIELVYTIQEKSKGLADGVKRCKHFIGNDSIVLLLGDNFFYGLGFDNLLEKAISENVGATMFGIQRNHSHMITTIEHDDYTGAYSLVRKFSPKGKIISPGIFIYNCEVSLIIEKILSENPEADWVEINNEYQRNNELSIMILGKELIWYDVGIPDSRLKAEMFVFQVQEQGLGIGCIEEIAYRKNWITQEELLKQLDVMEDSNYKKYLQKIVNECD